MSEQERYPINVWRFHDAPTWMRQLSPHGGDEDWLAYVPKCQNPDGWIGWLESGTPFGVCDVSSHPQDDGSCIFIGAHA